MEPNLSELTTRLHTFLHAKVGQRGLLSRVMDDCVLEACRMAAVTTLTHPAGWWSQIPVVTSGLERVFRQDSVSLMCLADL